jgi:hypothetical protein
MFIQTTPRVGCNVETITLGVVCMNVMPFLLSIVSTLHPTLGVVCMNMMPFLLSIVSTLHPTLGVLLLE